MIKPFEFYFDFVSPYSFLAHKEIRKIENKEKIKIKYNPILLGGLHNLHGIKAPAFIPAKARHMIRDCKLIAERNNVRFKFNSYFPIRSLNLMRGVLVAEEDNIKNKSEAEKLSKDAIDILISLPYETQRLEDLCKMIIERQA